VNEKMCGKDGIGFAEFLEIDQGFGDVVMRMVVRVCDGY